MLHMSKPPSAFTNNHEPASPGAVCVSVCGHVGKEGNKLNVCMLVLVFRTISDNLHIIFASIFFLSSRPQVLLCSFLSHLLWEGPG